MRTRPRAPAARVGLTPSSRAEGGSRLPRQRQPGFRSSSVSHRPGVDISLHAPLKFVVMILLVSLFAASEGLALGCSMNQQHISLMFSMVITPMIFFGCTYYPWSALKTFPILQKAVLVNPLVYASEGLRATLVPQFPHLSLIAVFVALMGFNALFLTVGLRQFHKKAVS